MKIYLNVFDEMGEFWAEIADQNQTERQLKFIESTLNTTGLVLDLACGTGRHLISLAEAGYRVVGLDVSPRLLRIAKLRWRGADLVRADMRFLPFKPEVFSATISMDASFGYLPSEEDDLQSFKEVKAAMCTGGVFVIDVFNREKLVKRHQDGSKMKWIEYSSFLLRQKRSVTGDGGELHDEWVVSDKARVELGAFRHVARLYEPERLHVLMEAAGFEVHWVFGDYEKQTFSSDSNRLILVADAK